MLCSGRTLLRRQGSATAVNETWIRPKQDGPYSRRDCLHAGAAALLAREFNVEFERKADGSPVTRADLIADASIREALSRAFPGLPIVSEECAETFNGSWPEAFFIADPIDGTREFIEGRDEFTVNIALVDSGRPVAGAISAPAFRRVWYSGTKTLCAGSDVAGDITGSPRVVTVREWPAAPVALVSRSHADEASLHFVKQRGAQTTRPIGSSLKFCMIASGEADFYARLAPTHEWDIAAGDAILSAAGGAVRDPSGAPIRYGNFAAKLLVPGFVASGDGTRVTVLSANQ